MKKYLLTFCGLAYIIIGSAQNTVALENKPHTLQERHYLMKTNSESYQDYKVIKEYILDGVWKIALDSLAKREAQMAKAKTTIDSLQSKLTGARNELKSKTDSMADVVYASNHINVLGKNFSKSTFLILLAIVAIAIGFIMTLLVMRLIEMRRFVHESKLMMTNANNELEDYKHKALEKQIKLARDLQTERNKLADLLEQNKRLV